MNDRLPVAVKVRDKKTEITLVYVTGIFSAVLCPRDPHEQKF